jgi:hypothetical protein
MPWRSAGSYRVCPRREATAIPLSKWRSIQATLPDNAAVDGRGFQLAA